LAPPLWVAWRPPFLLFHFRMAAGQTGYFVIAEIVSKKDKADDLRALLVPSPRNLPRNQVACYT